MTLIGIYGAGGFAKEIIPFLKPQYPEQICLIDDNPAVGKDLLGINIVSSAAFAGDTRAEKRFNIAVANPATRKKLAEDMLTKNVKPVSFRAPEAIVYEGAEVGMGSILCAHSMVFATAKIGKFFHCSVYSYVEHDCVIGDYVTFSPRVSCNGAVHIGDGVFVGSGAVIRNGSPEKPLKIGEGAVIGMGAVVTKDVPAYATVVGNPARILNKG